MRKLIYFCFIFTVLTFLSCAKKRAAEPAMGQENTIQSMERTISILYPASSEGNQSLSESEIEAKFNQVANLLFPIEERAKLSKTTKADFSKFVSAKIASSPEIQTLISQLKQSGVIFAENGITKEAASRYGGTAHQNITTAGAYVIMENFLSAYPDSTLVDQNLSQLRIKLGVGGDPYHNNSFALNVKEEDEVDLVFGLDQMYIDVPPFATIPLKTIDANIAKDVITNLHFYNPDISWNAGLTGTWDRVKPLAINLVKKMTSIELLPEEIEKRAAPAYAVEILRSSPSSYHKALCLWYGWKVKNITIIGDNLFSFGEFVSSTDSYPGIKDIYSNNPSQAAKYLAHIVHLLEDASVPCHVHNDPHGPKGENDPTGIMGGSDAWENVIVNKFLEHILPKDTFSFRISMSQITDFKKYTSRIVQATADLSESGTFYQQVKEYYDRLQGVYGLYPLFFSNAQAAQFFPTYKEGLVMSKAGNSGTPNGTFYFAGTKGFDSGPYNSLVEMDAFNPEFAISNDLPAKEFTAYERGKFYLVYVGTDFIQNIPDPNMILQINFGKISIKEDYKSSYRLYYLGYPYDKMAEHLLPVAVATATRLVRNYFYLY